MKKLEKYKRAPQAKFVKFKVKQFVEIPTIRHDKVHTCIELVFSIAPLRYRRN